MTTGRIVAPGRGPGGAVAEHLGMERGSRAGCDLCSPSLSHRTAALQSVEARSMALGSGAHSCSYHDRAGSWPLGRLSGDRQSRGYLGGTRNIGAVWDRGRRCACHRNRCRPRLHRRSLQASGGRGTTTTQVAPVLHRTLGAHTADIRPHPHRYSRRRRRELVELPYDYLYRIGASRDRTCHTQAPRLRLDDIINRTAVYLGLTIYLGLAYYGSVVVLQSVIGGDESPPFVVAASTLAAAALFRPVRGRIQSLIDRRFNRRKYDAALTIEGFSARLRDEMTSTRSPSTCSKWCGEPWNRCRCRCG